MANLLLTQGAQRLHVPSVTSGSLLSFANYPVLLHHLCTGMKGNYSVGVIGKHRGYVIWLNGQTQLTPSQFAADVPTIHTGTAQAQAVAALPSVATARTHSSADIQIQTPGVAYQGPIRFVTDLFIGAHLVEHTPSDPNYAGVAISRLGTVPGLNRHSRQPVNSPLDICIWGVRRNASVQVQHTACGDLLTHKQVFLAVEYFRSSANQQSITSFRKALQDVCTGVDPSQIQLNLMVGTLSGDFVLKWYKWIGMQEDVNYPIPMGCRGRLKPIDCIDMVFNGTPVSGLPWHCCQ